MTFDKKDFNYEKFPNSLMEDPSCRVTQISFNKWWNTSMSFNTAMSGKITTLNYVIDIAKTALKLLSYQYLFFEIK